jgi:hypothetical protein
MAKLTGYPCTLVNLRVFFEPDAIHEVGLTEGSKSLDDNEFEFVHDEME